VRLTVIGCSGSFPGPDSPASCYLFEADGFRLVLDLGSGAVGVLQRYLRISDIDAVCLSHHHPDHCIDMCPLWVSRMFGPDGRLRRIPVYGPEGTALRMAQAYGLKEHPGMTEAFDFVTLTPGTREIGPFQVTLAHMNHPVETFGFRVEHGGRSVAYSADTGECPALVDLARGADLLLCEASYLNGARRAPNMHLTAAQAAEHAAAAGVGRLVLTHLVPWNDRARSLAEASEVPFGGDVSLATQGEVVELGLPAGRPVYGCVANR
jgi:ribonuclease BN (tRNA processing enzyme)